MTAALRSRDVVALAAAVAGTAVAVLAGVLGWRWPTLVAVVVAVLAEPVARPGQLEAVLTRGSLDRLPRSILRMFAVLAAGSSVWTTSSMLPAFGWTAAVFIAANAALVLLLVYVEHARTPIVLMRNVDVPPPDIRPGPPRGVTSRTAAGIGVLELAILVPALLAPGSSRLLWLCGGLAVAVLVLLDCWLVAAARAVGTTLRGPALRRRVQDYLDRSRPEVLVYFGGRRESSYQLTMWLSTLERLPQRTVVLLRDPKVLADLPATSLPVLCVPGSVDLMALDLSSAHVGLFAANVGNSLHVLRLPHLMTVFIGHGDSDKSASSSPFAKAYDEIWVAGPAGRERYRRAQVGVRDEDIVEVGRPQLDGLLATAVRTDHPVPTLLYAPTWEGWNSEQQYTSLDSMGVELVAAALASSPPVRVIYKPHPFTGRRDPRIARADRQIVELLEAANAAGPGDPAMSGLGVAVGGASVPDGFDGAFSHSTTVRARDRGAAGGSREHVLVTTASGLARGRAGGRPVAVLLLPPGGRPRHGHLQRADRLQRDRPAVRGHEPDGRPAGGVPRDVPGDRGWSGARPRRRCRAPAGPGVRPGRGHLRDRAGVASCRPAGERGGARHGPFRRGRRGPRGAGAGEAGGVRRTRGAAIRRVLGRRPGE